MCSVFGGLPNIDMLYLASNHNSILVAFGPHGLLILGMYSQKTPFRTVHENEFTL